jgi:hypothetical protein
VKYGKLNSVCGYKLTWLLKPLDLTPACSSAGQAHACQYVAIFKGIFPRLAQAAQLRVALWNWFCRKKLASHLLTHLANFNKTKI